jgi:hypothetical protein
LQSNTGENPIEGGASFDQEAHLCAVSLARIDACAEQLDLTLSELMLPARAALFGNDCQAIEIARGQFSSVFQMRLEIVG